MTKKKSFDDKQNDLAQIAKALAHPVRIAILEQLFQIETCFCGDLVKELGLAQSTISQHLKVLKKAKIIQGTIEGTYTCYCIDPKIWQKYQNSLHLFFNQFKPTIKNN